MEEEGQAAELFDGLKVISFQQTQSQQIMF